MQNVFADACSKSAGNWSTVGILAAPYVNSHNVVNCVYCCDGCDASLKVCTFDGKTTLDSHVVKLSWT